MAPRTPRSLLSTGRRRHGHDTRAPFRVLSARASLRRDRARVGPRVSATNAPDLHAPKAIASRCNGRWLAWTPRRHKSHPPNVEGERGCHHRSYPVGDSNPCCPQKPFLSRGWVIGNRWRLDDRAGFYAGGLDVGGDPLSRPSAPRLRPRSTRNATDEVVQAGAATDR